MSEQRYHSNHMPRTRLIQDRGAARPHLLKSEFGTVTFTAPEQNAKTWAVGPTGMRGLLEYGPSVPGPFGEVVGLIGERGREVNEFVRETLGPQGLARAVVVAAPADTSPVARLQGAMLATCIAEHFRDQRNGVIVRHRELPKL